MEIKPDLKNMLVWRHATGSKNFLMLIPEIFFCLQIFYPSYAYPGERSKLFALSFYSLFSVFDFSYPLSSAQVSLDCAILGRQTN